MELIWIQEAEYLEDYKIQIQFSNGRIGIADLKGKLNGPIFEPLRDIMVFKDFSVNEWTIEWACEVDVAPEFLYREAMKNELSTKEL